MNSERLDRWLKLEGLENVRDVGGLPLDGGGSTRSGVLLRSASLRYVTEADVSHLKDVFGLRLVLDLRTAREIERDGPTA
ncbi:MAG: tyrosine-protein phosphatase, partial [Pseudonocardia sp.]